ncbi:MAG: TetR/AcrR family transcriptional regulator [Proteobacteria bacterium]|nr:TetR/AcrR family transcriptional regulator [Pseudomonadota bacterium]
MNLKVVDAGDLPLRERNKLRTRVRIIAAAERLLAERGIAGTSIEELARVADISRATFFNYFPSKGAVVQALVQRLEEDFRGSAARRGAGRMTTAERLMALFMDTSRRLKSAPALYKAILGEAEQGYSHAEESQVRFERMHRAVRAILADGVARGEVRRDIALPVLAEMVAGIYISILHNWRAAANYPLDSRLRSAASFLVEALAPVSARRVSGSAP